MVGLWNFNYMPEKKEFSFYLYDKPTLVIIDWFNLYNKYKNVDLQLFFDYLKGYKDVYQVRFYQGTIEGKDWSIKTIGDANQIGYKVVTKRSKYIKIDIHKESHLKNIMNLLDGLLDSISEKNSEIANKIYTFKTEIEKKYKGTESADIYSDFFVWVGEMDTDLEKLNINIKQFKNEINKPITKPKCDFDAEIAKDIILDINNFENLILFSGDGDFASTVEYLIKEKSKKVFVIYPQGSFGEIDYENFNLIKKLDTGKREYAKGFVCRPVDHLVSNIIKKEPADCSAGPDINNISITDSQVK